MKIVINQSTTVKSAQSKKCRMLDRVRTEAATSNSDIEYRTAKAQIRYDVLLGQVCTEAEIENARAGMKPSRGRSRTAGVEVEI